MARLLAIDWDQDQFHILAVNASRRGVTLEKTLTWPLGEELTAANGEALGRKLRDALKAAGFAPAPIVACLGRERVIVKELRYPAVPPSEEPALVRFQAAKELSEQPDDVVIDYAPLSPPGQAGERLALAVALKRHLANAWQALARGLGVKLAGLTPRPHALVGAVARAQALGRGPAGETLALVTVGTRWAELSIVSGERVLFARSLAVGPALAGEIKRSLSVFTTTTGATPPAALLVTGKPDKDLEQRLSDSAELPVQRLEPFAENEQVSASERGMLAAAVGAAHLWAKSETLPINFAAPKQPVITADLGKRRKVIWAAAAAVVLIAVIFFGNRVLSDKQTKIRELVRDKLEVENRLKKMAPERLDVEALREWEETSVSWLDEIYDLTSRFPYQIGIRVKDFSGGLIAKRGPKDQYIAQISLTAIARENQDALVAQWVEAINTDKHLRATPSSHTNLGNGSQQFKLNIDIAKHPPDRYVTILKAPPRQFLIGGDPGEDEPDTTPDTMPDTAPDASEKGGGQ